MLTLKPESIALMVSEDEPTFPKDSAEGREVGTLEKRSTLANFINGIHGGNLLGAEAEYRSAILSEGFGVADIPLSMLLPRSDRQMEERAVTPVAAAAISEGAQQTIGGRVFARSVPAFLGIPMPSVAAGAAGFHGLTGWHYLFRSVSQRRTGRCCRYVRGGRVGPDQSYRKLRVSCRGRGQVGRHRRRLAGGPAGGHG